MEIDLRAWDSTVTDLPEHVAPALVRSGLVDVAADTPPSRWRLITDSRVGVLDMAGCTVRVRPRLAIPRLMFLLSYAVDPKGWRRLGPLFGVEDELFAAVAHGFAVHAERALSPAPLRGYLSIDDQALTLRGRLRVGDQTAKWAGLPIPLEVTYDDHVIDVPENRLIRGAAELLLRLSGVPQSVRRRLLRVRATLEEVEPVRPSPLVRAPELTRLNERYAGALAMAELILRGTSISSTSGGRSSVEFLFDMNKVFEDFLAVALAGALERHGGRVRTQYRDVVLDEDREVHLKPDLTWWAHGRCRAIIDAKYKSIAHARTPNADVYQMLAYCTAFDLGQGHLVYARSDQEQARLHTIRNLGTRIHVHTIDVEREPAEVLGQVEELAAVIADARLASPQQPA
jgi:5-methylcytosine-specific restriction enzyme subunit McrC